MPQLLVAYTITAVLDTWTVIHMTAAKFEEENIKALSLFISRSPRHPTHSLKPLYLIVKGTMKHDFRCPQFTFPHVVTYTPGVT
jgi:hypothetical protein